MKLDFGPTLQCQTMINHRRIAYISLFNYQFQMFVLNSKAIEIKFMLSNLTLGHSFNVTLMHLATNVAEVSYYVEAKICTHNVRMCNVLCNLFHFFLFCSSFGRCTELQECFHDRKYHRPIHCGQSGCFICHHHRWHDLPIHW